MSPFVVRSSCDPLALDRLPDEIAVGSEMARSKKPLRERFYEVPPGTKHLVVVWERFRSFDEACARFPVDPCLYTFANPESRASLYVGKATCLRRRYAAAFGALRALMSEAKALLFVACVEPSHLELVEHTIVFWDCTSYNKRLKYTRPWPEVSLLHRHNGVSSWWGSGNAVETGATYDGPLFCRPGDLRYRDTGAER